MKRFPAHSNSGADRVIGIVGSPRVGGNTDLLVDAVLAGAADCGAATEKVHLSHLTIAPCRGCDGCRTRGRCVFADDMDRVLERMGESRVWVLGTPVYYWGPTGWFKSFIDRWYGVRDQLDFSSKRAVVVIPMEDTNLRTARHTVGMLEDTLRYLKIDLIETIVAPGVLHPGEINSKSEILAAARCAGQSAVSGCCAEMAS